MQYSILVVEGTGEVNMVREWNLEKIVEEPVPVIPSHL